MSYPDGFEYAATTYRIGEGTPFSVNYTWTDEEEVVHYRSFYISMYAEDGGPDVPAPDSDFLSALLDGLGAAVQTEAGENEVTQSPLSYTHFSSDPVALS